MDIAKCTVDELEAFLTSNLEGRVESPDSVASAFKHHKIDGSAFLKLLPEEIQEIVPIIGERKVVTSIIHSNQESSAITVSMTIHVYVYNYINFIDNKRCCQKD